MGRPGRPLDVDASAEVRELAGWLRSVRADSGLTLREIADRSRTSPATLSRALNGTALPSERTLHALLRALEVPADGRAEVLDLYQRARSPQTTEEAPDWVDDQLPGAMHELHTRAGSPSVRWISDQIPMHRSAVHRALREPLSSPMRALQVAEFLAKGLPRSDQEWAETMVLGPLQSAPARRAAPADDDRAAAANDSGFRRVPPQDLDAEQAVLGSMLLSRDAIIVVAKILSPEDFYRPAHELIYKRCIEMHTDDRAVDPFTLASAVSSQDLDRMGGETYLHVLVQAVPSPGNADWYAQSVRDKAVLRRLVEASSRIAQMAYGDDRPVDEIVGAAHELIRSAAQQRNVRASSEGRQ